MKARTYNSLIGRVHHPWAAEILEMRINPSFGPDLVDHGKAVELKFCLKNDKGSYIQWKILDHQMKYGRNGNLAYWGLATYELNKPITEINVSDASQLERFVTTRELWLVNWDWASQFKAYHETGECYDNWLRFAKGSSLPITVESKKVKGGCVHLTKGVNPEMFPTITSRPTRLSKDAPF